MVSALGIVTVGWSGVPGRSIAVIAADGPDIGPMTTPLRTPRTAK